MPENTRISLHMAQDPGCAVEDLLDPSPSEARSTHSINLSVLDCGKVSSSAVLQNLHQKAAQPKQLQASCRKST